MDIDAVFVNAKRAVSDQRQALDAVQTANAAAADDVLLRKSADTIVDLAAVMALTKENPT